MQINFIAVDVLQTAFSSIKSREHWSLHFLHVIVCSFNPLPFLTLQSTWDLNVPCQPKRSKALVLVCKLNAR
jgi:hypothetical protein